MRSRRAGSSRFSDGEPEPWDDRKYFEALAFLARTFRTPMDYFENLDEIDFIAQLNLANDIAREEREAMERARRG